LRENKPFTLDLSCNRGAAPLLHAHWIQGGLWVIQVYRNYLKHSNQTQLSLHSISAVILVASFHSNLMQVPRLMIEVQSCYPKHLNLTLPSLHSLSTVTDLLPPLILTQIQTIILVQKEVPACSNPACLSHSSISAVTHVLVVS
jgi:hypothetical protein